MANIRDLTNSVPRDIRLKQEGKSFTSSFLGESLPLAAGTRSFTFKTPISTTSLIEFSFYLYSSAEYLIQFFEDCRDSGASISPNSFPILNYQRVSPTASTVLNDNVTPGVFLATDAIKVGAGTSLVGAQTKLWEDSPDINWSTTASTGLLWERPEPQHWRLKASEEYCILITPQDTPTSRTVYLQMDWIESLDL